MITPYNDEYFMKQAYQEALKAFEADEIPVGAVIVANNQIIARAHNLTEQLTDVTAHAEIQAITAAAGFIGGKYLSGCTLYVTLEPCVMCAGALYWSQIDKVVFGARDEKRGAGNVGKSFAKQVAQENFDWYVLELSSFQLDDMFEFKADVSILLNITPDHLDRYNYEMQNYVDSKLRIIQNQSENDWFIYNADDETIVNEIKKRMPK
eukprot:gene28806-50696_t